MARKLTDKQQRFIEQYLKLGSARDAYIEVYDVNKMSDRAIRVEASRLLSNPNISLAVDNAQLKRRDKVIEKTSIDASWVLKQSLRIYRSALEINDIQKALKAIELIGKHRDIMAWKEQVQVTKKTDYAQLLEARAKKAEEAILKRKKSYSSK